MATVRMHGRQVLVQCEIAAAEKNPTMAHLGQSTVHTVALREDNELSAARPNGQWLVLPVER